jgi:hypothetical protein
MTLPLRQCFNAPSAEGVLVSLTTQEGEVWRIAVWLEDSSRCATLLHPHGEVRLEEIERSDIELLLDAFETMGIAPAAGEVTPATDGEIWSIVTKRSGHQARYVTLINPDLNAEWAPLAQLARSALFEGKIACPSQ